MINLNIDILDALADDFEGTEQIKKYLIFLGYELKSNEIEEAIQNMLNQELIFVNKNISDNEYTWYGLTEKGKSLWIQETEKI